MTTNGILKICIQNFAFSTYGVLKLLESYDVMHSRRAVDNMLHHAKLPPHNQHWHKVL